MTFRSDSQKVYRILEKFSVFLLNLTQRKVLCSLLWKLEDSLKGGT